MGTQTPDLLSPHHPDADVDSPTTNLPPLPVMSPNDNWYPYMSGSTPRDFGTPGQPAWQGLMSPTAWEPKGLNWDAKTGPITFTITDRQVYIPDESNPPSLYSMLRGWVQNETEPQPRPPEPAPLTLEKVAPPEPESSAGPTHAPAYNGDESETVDTEERMSSLKQHWRAVRLYHQGIQKQKQERHRTRLANLISGAFNKPQNAHSLAHPHQGAHYPV